MGSKSINTCTNESDFRTTKYIEEPFISVRIVDGSMWATGINEWELHVDG